MSDQSASEPLEQRLEAAGVALAAGDLAAAEEEFSQATALAPKDPRPHGGLALIAMQLGDLPRSVAHGRSAAALSGSGPEIHYNLGFVLAQIGETTEATAAFLAAYRASPERPEPINGLLRLGVVPHEEDEEPGEPLALETLLRLDLYEALGEPLHAGPAADFTHTHGWASQRGAPWGPVVAWLMQQGAHSDREVIERLAPADMHLTTSRAMGMILGNHSEMMSVFEKAPPIQRIGKKEDASPRANGEEAPVLIVRLDDDMQRAEIPPQLIHAPRTLSLLGSILPMLGPDPSLILILDPVEHLGPRRVWMITPFGEIEVVGEWKATNELGEEAERAALPSTDAVPAGEVPLALPGVDAASLRATLEDSGVHDIGRIPDEGGGLYIDADRAGDQEEAWIKFLTRVSRWIPQEKASVARWRKDGSERMAVLRRGETLVVYTLESVWPEGQDQLDLPVSAEVQLLGRALFGAPKGRIRRSDT
jgi:tetratricopeptide (TPR) repeat protein